MSNSRFDPEVELVQVMVRGEPEVADDFTVKGPLGQDEGKEPQQREDLRIFVSIWQTEADTIHGGSADVIVARALGEGKQVPGQLGNWSAGLTMRKGAFKPDCPATGLAFTVEDTGDATGFETYTWTGRLQIKAP